MFAPGRTEFTPKERNEIYKIALEMYEAGKSPYLCNCIYKAFSTKWFHLDIKECLNAMVEFKSYFNETRTIGKKWFPEENRKSRLFILRTCIILSGSL